MSQVAEIHVMQKHHKEKMKKIKMDEKGVVNEDNKTCGCGKKVVSAIRQLLSCGGSKPAIIWDYKDA
ncbi:hypothetical protein A4A49_02335 [Nicotiana attenuata]|uniref:Uncharacterized protein n=1 Tax=Nicotiana attenuata TaxID=49451 RepID=A0A314L926_NICAT|nr:hypothetical protein A4A49_02335 [Nicotiana attenuata]